MMSGLLAFISAACIARMAVPSMRSASATAACMASVFATITEALRRRECPRVSASAMARAEAVRFSILELAADSDRSSTEAKGAISSPSSASKRAISWLASSASARMREGRETSRFSTSAGIAAW